MVGAIAFLSCKRPKCVEKCGLVVSVTLIFLGAAQAQTSLEYELKAAFLYRFTEFVEWPAQAFSTPQSPIRVCIFGLDPFGNALDRTLRGEQVKGRPLVAMRTRRMEELSACHIVFISRSEREQAAAVLSRLRENPVLSVSEAQDFLEQGGMINFVTEGARIRFEINNESAQRAGLMLSSKLLTLARAVRPGGRPQ